MTRHTSSSNPVEETTKMKLFVVLLALSLTAAEKLNRRYLPPPGAKFSGGRSDDLQTPLEYPKESLTYGIGEYGSTVYATDDNDVRIGTPDENKISMIINEHYYENLSHLRSGFNPGHMPIIAVSKNITQNYQPHLFGMYGGNPMSIKPFDTNIEMDGSDELITSNEKINVPEEKVEPDVRPIQNIRNLQVEQYQPTNPGANTGTITTLGGKGQNRSIKKIERPQAYTDRTSIVLNYKNIQNPDGYFFNFDTSNGIHRDESASTAKGVKAKGSYSYKGDDGIVYTVTYTADENGFQASGDHLPQIPEAIQNVIEQANNDKRAGIVDDGSYDDSKYGHMKYQGPVHRYMQKNAKTHKRKKISGEQKKLGPSKIEKYETNNIIQSRTENVSKQNKNRKPLGIKRIQQFDYSRNEEDAMYIQSPVTKKSHDYTSDYSQKVKNNKVLSNGMVLQNIQRNRGILNSNKEKILIIPTVQDGYFYVPPENVLVDGKYQDNSTYAINNTSILITELSTEKPLFQQTYDSDLYVSTNSDVNRATERNPSKASPSKKYDTTEQYFSNTLSTIPYDNEFTKENFQKEETVIPENKVESGFLSKQTDYNTANYESTTPMSSEVRYTIQTYGNTNQYDTSESALTSSDVDYSEDEGYFKTTPEKPATFEDFSSSAYNSYIYTTEGTISTESTTNVKADKFGRTRQDSFGYLTDSSSDRFTNVMQSVNEPKVSTLYNDYEETYKTDKPKTLDISITQFPSEYGTDVSKTTDDLHLGKGAIIGEDFSGPKQKPNYDPKKGYYY